MSHLLAEKALDCLLFIAARTDEEAFSEWAERYDVLVDKWGEKRVMRQFESLADRGYIDYGVSARMGWLTDKGKQKVMEAASGQQLAELMHTWMAT